MATRWFYEIDGRQYGPVPALKLRLLAAEGKLRSDHLVWKEGRDRKAPAGTVKGLFGDKPSDSSQDASLKPSRALVKQEPEYEEIEEVVAAPVEPVGEETPVLLAETAVIYREGYPDLDGPISGILYVESTGLRFVYEADEEEDELPFPWKRVEHVLEPARGDFPPSMKTKALGAAVGAKAGRLAAGLMGNLIGGMAGDAVAHVGKEASKMAEEGGKLGKPPRNRIRMVARVRKEKCKLIFDVDGADRDEMNDEANALFKHIEKARARVAEIEPTPAAIALVGEVDEPEPVMAEVDDPEVVACTAEKPYRVMSAGRIQGPYTLDELRGLLAANKLERTDLIGVETWLPVATIQGLLPGASAPAVPPRSAPAPPKADGGLIPADDQFRLL